ncbi:MAG: xanthine dehydrogenase family protein subunit M [Alphaproteobacteria bacterium]|nr:xanthine dehydrogenase family protein subunit M [Alphaproteobacteria bacterium]
MKPSLFDYCSPQTVSEVVSALSEDPGAMILAGGQSLVPAMNLRLASPTRLVDIKNVADLSDISISDGVIKVGAMVRHRDLELDDTVHAAHPLIREMMHYVAHVPIRNRGTVVGSLCHADAAAEMPLLLLLAGGTVTAVGPNGTRDIAAAEFFQFHMTTSRAPDEMILHANIPVLPEGAGYAFHEFARRQGDYAIAAVGAILSVDGGNTVTSARVGACGIASTPVLLNRVEEAITGSTLTKQSIDDAAKVAGDAVTLPDDMHATTGYRKHLLSGLVRRVLAEAAERATGEPVQ